MKNKARHILMILGCLIALSCNSQKKEDDRLIGKWQGGLKDSKTGGLVEYIVLEFTNDGKFLQHVGEGQMKNTVESTYELRDDKIITIEKDTKEKAESKYTIKNDTLIILYEGMENKYIKLKQ